ncbi:MAG: hypothetical protein KIT09_18755 [Bryobacteraceae bacterium]|nr:hypothetical protein [Bryobacteraceae bacterium]
MKRLWTEAALLCLVAMLARWPGEAQICRLSVAGLNRDRRVMGPVSAECPHPLHSAPFGNWGVTSNFGQKLNGHQFQGWCHNMRVCDNAGQCMNNCRDGWYEWNSCTTHALYQPPNCSLYNAAECTEQVSPLGINVLGTQAVDVPVTCPSDTNRDGALDSGGCADLTSYSRSNNFMSLYELDPATADELVQTIYYSDLVVPLRCDVFDCPLSGSEWARPIAYDSPPSPAKVFAEMAMVVNFGSFLDPRQACRPAATTLAAVSAASYQAGLPVAPGSIVSLFDVGFAEKTEAASNVPLPLRLAGVQVYVIDSRGRRTPAPLLFVSPRQINCIVPAETAAGGATFSVEDATGVRSTGVAQIEAVAPSLFTANNDGRGAPAAVAVRVTAGGHQTPLDVFRCGDAPGTCEPAPISSGAPSDQVIVSLFGTGIRGRSALENVQATIGDESADVLYAGPQPQFEGLDQVNVRIPESLAGAGRVEVRLLVDTRPSNAVTIDIR